MLDAMPPDLARNATHPRRVGGDMVPFVAANAWIKAATHCRFNIDPMFQAAGVSLSAGNVAMIRHSALLVLMQQCVQQAAPAQHFPLVLGELFAFDHLPALETFLATSPTLRHALPALQWAGMCMPNLHLQLHEHGTQAELRLDVDMPQADATSRGYFVEAVFAAISKIVRLAMGHTDLIQHIDMQHQPPELFMKMTAAFPAPIRTRQARDAAIFSTRLLDMPLPGASPGLHQHAQALITLQMPLAEGSLLAQIERGFRQMPALLGQGIDSMAERLKLHPRTLQRHLQKSGEAYTAIQARCRLEMAQAALTASRCDIEALSAQLGFADRHSFTRAFKRWTGLSPSAYRRQHQTGTTGDPT
jgi:AraC-like DNA-binding protein